MAAANSAAAVKPMGFDAWLRQVTRSPGNSGHTAITNSTGTDVDADANNGNDNTDAKLAKVMKTLKIVPAIPTLPAISRASPASTGSLAQYLAGASSKSDTRDLTAAASKVVPATSVVQTVVASSRPVPQNMRKTYPVQLHPLTKFLLFPNLPAELRIKVWEFHMLQPRLIEIERGPNPAYEEHDYRAFDIDFHRGHRWIRVSRRSRLPPTIFSINREAREEAGKHYELALFDTHTRNNQQSPIYFNPESDIVLFGEGTCLSSIIVFSQVIALHGHTVKRVAVRCTGQVTNVCCNIPSYWQISHGCNILQALHGMDPEETDAGTLIPGFPDLREISLVAPSKLWHKERGEIDASIAFRPAVGDGLTKGQVKYKADSKSDIDSIEEGRGLQMVGENKWIGDKKPTFRFMSLCPGRVGVTDKIYDSIVVSLREANRLHRKEALGVVKRLRKSTRCIIDLAGHGGGHLVGEVGFYGTEQSIEKAKVEVRKLTAPAARRFG